MNGDLRQFAVVVLSSKDTQGWHSPFSNELRRWRRQRILERCRKNVLDSGHPGYLLYDAMENYLLREHLVEQ